MENKPAFVDYDAYQAHVSFMNHEPSTWSVFANTHWICVDVPANIWDWVTELNFYAGDLSDADFAKDDRFKEVPKRRKQVEFLGIVNNFTFPMPDIITLTNGKVINRKDYHEGKSTLEME